MKIETGKRYVRRDGSISGIIWENFSSDEYPFQDERYMYDSVGKVYHSSEDSRYDLTSDDSVGKICHPSRDIRYDLISEYEETPKQETQNTPSIIKEIEKLHDDTVQKLLNELESKSMNSTLVSYLNAFRIDLQRILNNRKGVSNENRSR